MIQWGKNLGNVLTGKAAHGSYRIIEVLNRNACTLEYVGRSGTNHIIVNSAGEVLFKSANRAIKAAEKHNERIIKNA